MTSREKGEWGRRLTLVALQAYHVQIEVRYWLAKSSFWQRLCVYAYVVELYRLRGTWVGQADQWEASGKQVGKRLESNLGCG